MTSAIIQAGKILVPEMGSNREKTKRCKKKKALLDDNSTTDEKRNTYNWSC